MIEIPARRRWGSSMAVVRGLHLQGVPFLLLPGFILYAGVFIYPLGRLVLLSFSSGDIGGGWTWANYLSFLSASVYAEVLLNTLRVAGITTAVCFMLGYPVAYILATVGRRTSAVLLIFLIVPMMTSVLVRSFSWIAILLDNGVINGFLKQVGIIHTPLPLLYNTSGLLIGMVNVMLPYMVLPILSVMVGIDRNLIRAAHSLGASPLRAFWSVYFPLSLPGVGAGALLTFILSLGFYITPALLGGPQDTMISQLIETQVDQLLAWQFASALSVILLAITIVIVLIYNRLFGLGQVLGGAAR